LCNKISTLSFLSHKLISILSVFNSSLSLSLFIYLSLSLSLYLIHLCLSKCQCFPDTNAPEITRTTPLTATHKCSQIQHGNSLSPPLSLSPSNSLSVPLLSHSLSSPPLSLALLHNRLFTWLLHNLYLFPTKRHTHSLSLTQLFILSLFPSLSLPLSITVSNAILYSLHYHAHSISFPLNDTLSLNAHAPLLLFTPMSVSPSSLSFSPLPSICLCAFFLSLSIRHLP